MSLSFALLKSLLDNHPPVFRLLVAYSGGVDSHVLLHLLASRPAEITGYGLAALYVDHGLHPDSARWGDHCAAICRELGVEFHRLRVDARPSPGGSPEAAARAARYRVLAEQLGPADALLTAQHRDDQAETVLLQLLRGGGPHGLAAMPARAPLGQGVLLRPLLDVERAELLAYAQAHELRWIDDSSNADRRLDRNYLRHAVLPLLKARWPALTATLARSARLGAEAAELADVLAEMDLPSVATERPDALNISTLGNLDEVRRRNVLRYWFRQLALPSPAAVHLQHILSEVIAAPVDRRPRVQWPGCEVRRYRDRLYAMSPIPPHDPGRIYPLDLAQSVLAIAGIGRLKWRWVAGQGIRLAELADVELTVQFRRGGERFRPQGRAHRQELKKLLQEAGVPPWERKRLPLIYAGERLAMVVGLGVGEEFAVRGDEMGLVVELVPSPTSESR